MVNQMHMRSLDFIDKNVTERIEEIRIRSIHIWGLPGTRIFHEEYSMYMLLMKNILSYWLPPIIQSMLPSVPRKVIYWVTITSTDSGSWHLDNVTFFLSIFYLFYLLIEIFNLDLSLNIWKSRGPEHLYYICLSVCRYACGQHIRKDGILRNWNFLTYFLRLLQHFSIEEIIKCNWRKVIMYIYVTYTSHFRKQKISDVIKMCMPCLTRVRNMVL